MPETRTPRRAQKPVTRPEHKIGPFNHGLGVSIWLNQVETETGIRYFRSITIAPRRYRDAKTGAWKNAVSFRPVDLSTLTLALDAARRYCATVPLPGQAVEGDELEELNVLPDGEIPNGQTGS